MCPTPPPLSPWDIFILKSHPMNGQLPLLLIVGLFRSLGDPRQVKCRMGSQLCLRDASRVLTVEECPLTFCKRHVRAGLDQAETR